MKTISNSPARIAFRTLLPSLAVTLAALGPAGCDSETARPRNTSVEQQLQQILDGSVAKPDVILPGAIAHYRNPAYRAWSGAAGLGEIDAKVAIHPGDQIRAGSITKTFVATVALQLVEEGALSLDGTLPAMLPATVTSRIAYADRITLRMLLNHTSGIPEWDTPEVDARVLTDPGHVYTTDEVIDLAARQPASFEPGSSWKYSNTNYTLVGLVLDGAGGKGWRALVRERVLQRLGLAHTFLPEPGDRTMAAPYIHGYQEVSGTMVDLSAVDPSMAGAGGGHAMVTTIQDLGRFLEALLGGELFARPGTLTAMTTMVEAEDESGLPYRYGLGLQSYDLPGGTTVIGNSGGTAGYATMMYRIAASDTTLVTSVNTSDMFVNAIELFIPAVQAVAPPAQ